MIRVQGTMPICALGERAGQGFESRAVSARSGCDRGATGPTRAGSLKSPKSKLIVRQIKELFHPLQIPGFNPFLEPFDALRAGAVREGIRHDPSARLALERVIADGVGGF